jgi:hypothetical protein
MGYPISIQRIAPSESRLFFLALRSDVAIIKNGSPRLALGANNREWLAEEAPGARPFLA